ncbi:MazG nucleotide pyrophosphohydrolase domain-containing protein [Micrococcoides hystricis]|uniref:MazG nucleotide pyrophosphohydrolase domain-containing protein n=1 Tax=Micrococcoides hystricis TaxID=1572761 RepID=A0ABV6PB78_9MICC
MDKLEPLDAAGELERLLWIVRMLREHCAWTAELDHDALTSFLIEEAYEAVEVIETKQLGETFAAELSDVLFQVVLHAQLAAEDGRFDFAKIAHLLAAKMVRRNPHVFTSCGELLPPEKLDALDVPAIATQWEHIKRAEKHQAADTAGARNSEQPATQSVTGPALATAQLMVARAQRAGEATPDTAGLRFTEADELADHLLAVVAAAEQAGLDAEQCLRTRLRSVDTFQ